MGETTIYWYVGIGLVAVALATWAVAARYAPTTAKAEGEPAPNGQCRTCGEAPAKHRASTITQTASVNGVRRRLREPFIPPAYRRELDRFAPIAYCDTCIHVVDACTDEHLARLRVEQARGMRREARQNELFLRHRDAIVSARVMGSRNVARYSGPVTLDADVPADDDAQASEAATT